MVKIIIISLIFLLAWSFSLKAQDINWRANNKNHLFSAYFGADYSFYYGISYGHLLPTKLRPLLLGTEITIPFGKDGFDDWRWRTSVQAELWENNNFSLSLKPAFIVRRYESPLAKMYNIGADVTMAFGYLRPGWGVSGIINYDRSFSTHITHNLLKNEYPEITDGWYSTKGGNFKFGTRLNLSLKSWHSFLTVGNHYGQNFKDNPIFPFFFEMLLQKQI